MSALVDAGAIAKVWLATLGTLAVQGTLLAIVAFALTRLGRLRPAWQAALWLVVAAKLALPWGPSLPYSLSDLLATLTSSHAADSPIVVGPGVVRVAGSPSAWPAIGWLALASCWLAGAGFVLTRAIVVQVRTARAARRAPEAPASARDLLAGLAARVGVNAPRLAIATADVGPHVVGLLRTVIVVPDALVDEPVLLRAALLHELAHVRRRDAIGRVIQIVAGAMMWWLPTMRLVQRRLEHAREAACDAWALDAGDISRTAYARLLVRMAQLRPLAGGAHDGSAPPHALALALAAHHALDARVAAVLGAPAQARLTYVHRIAIGAFACLALGGARTASAQPRGAVCVYTPALAVQLLQAFPQADADGDGTLSRDEACDLQAELRKLPEQERSSELPDEEAEIESLLSEPLCCNCRTTETFIPEVPTCERDEGAER